MKKTTLIKTFLVAVCLLGGGNVTWADTTLFSAEATAALSVPASTSNQRITSTNATISGGAMYVSNGQSEAKNLISAASGTQGFTLTNSNTIFKVTLPSALAEGDVISFKTYNNDKSNSVERGLWFTSTDSRPGSAPTAKKTETIASQSWSATLSYTVTSGDGICGENTFYIHRATGSTTYFANFKISRPSVTATLDHTAGAQWGSNTGASTVDAETEHYNNDAESGWAGCAYAKFSFSIPAGYTVKSATLTYSVNQGGNYSRDDIIYYMAKDFDIDWANFAGQTGTDLRNTGSRGGTAVAAATTGGKGDRLNLSQTVTSSVKAIYDAGQNYIIFQWTGNAGSADLYGKGAAAAKQPTLVLEIVPEIIAAIADCKAYDTSAAFATAIDAETFASAAAVYAFNTSYHITNGVLTDGIRDITGVIRNAAVADGTDWGGSSTNHGEQYTGAPDEYYIDKYDGTINTNQTIYGVPAGTYIIKAATRSAAGTDGTLYANDGTSDVGKVNQITSVGNTGGDLDNGWSWSEMTFTLTETKNILLGFWADASSTKWAGCDDFHMYKVESVSKTITSAGWATYCSPYALDFTSSIANLTKAYFITGNSGATLTLSPITTTIPANTGILLEGTGAVAIPVVASSSTDVSANILTGVTAETPLAANDGYVLMDEAAGVGFYKNNNAFTLGANTAYLPAGSVSGARSFYLFEDDATAIEAIKAQNVENGQFFNLAGQRVAQPTKGLYIVNGKKVIIK